MHSRIRWAEPDNAKRGEHERDNKGTDYLRGALQVGWPPMTPPREYDDIPGTTIFDGRQCRRGFHLNQFCMSLMKVENRARFKAGERLYLDEWLLTEAQKRAVLTRDYNAMIAEGGNIYFLGKIGATDSLSFVQIVSTMTGMTVAAYTAMTIGGGRSTQGQLSKRPNALSAGKLV
jgi:protocatechuate 4,5-dioxygenase, alpha chain